MSIGSSFAAVWALDDVRWREVARGLREQGARRDVVPEAANSFRVLLNFLIKGRQWRAAAHGADLPAPAVPIPTPPWRVAAQAAGLPRPTVPFRKPLRKPRWCDSRPRWWEASHGSEVPLMFLIKGQRWRAAPQGADVPPLAPPVWDAERALAALNIREVPFDGIHAHLLGYARGRSIAVSPTRSLPHLTRFHELAHVLLGHTAEGEQHDSERTPCDLRECEAEAVAMLCCAALGLPGVGFGGTYIQQWWGAGKIPRQSVQRILKAVDQILEAGTSTPADGDHS